MVHRADTISAGDIYRFLKYFWETWNVQAIVLASLAFQVVLIFAAPSRKRTKSSSCVLTLWSVYLLADYIATFAIGLINNGSQIQPGTTGSTSESCGTFKHNAIAALWAPFLLLHLGGPDTITAFAIEDNELWQRHLLSLIVQVLSVLLVFYRYHMLNNEFLIPTALTFIAGVIKYAERTYSLNLAALPNLKKSMLNEPDAGPDYAQLMEDMASKQDANLPVTVDSSREKGAKPVMDDDGSKRDNKDQQAGNDSNTEKGANKGTLDELEVVKHGYKFFRTFRGLIVDRMFSFLERDESRSFYLSLEYEDAFKVMEVELDFMYDAMFTKMIAVHGKFIGYAFRFTCTALIVTATVLFSQHPHQHMHRGDLVVTYFLLGGAVALDFIAIVELIFSKWTVALLLRDSEKNYTTESSIGKWKKKFATMIGRVKGLIPTKRWSEEMHQYSFINHCLKKRPKWVYTIIDLFGLTETVDSCLYTKTRDVEDALKKLIFDEIKRKGKAATETSFAKEIFSSKGEWALLDYNCGPEIFLTVSQDVDYDQCVLMWHIATEIFYFSSKAKNPQDGESKSSDVAKAKNSQDDADICRYISEYLLYLLVMERKMTTTVAGIVEIRFRDTCQEATNFFNRGQQKQKTRRCFSWCSLQTLKKLKKACQLTLEDIKYVFTLGCFRTQGRKRKPTMWEEYQNTEEDEKRENACKLYLLSMMKSTLEDIKYVFTLRCFKTKGRKRKPTMWEEYQNTLEDEDRKKACESLKSVIPQVKPAEVKGDKSKSVLFDACILAGNLERLCHPKNGTYSEKEVWEMMSKVWVELLSYGACHCRGDAHAQYLSKGGELLTFVWLLMAHFGLGNLRFYDSMPLMKVRLAD